MYGQNGIKILLSEIFGSKPPADDREFELWMLDALLNGLGVSNRMETRIASDMMEVFFQGKGAYGAGVRLASGEGINPAYSATMGYLVRILESASVAAAEEEYGILPFLPLSELPPFYRARKAAGYDKLSDIE